MLVHALQKVFRKPAYGVLALVISASVFVFAVWLPNIRLVAGILSSPDVPFLSKIKVPLSLLGSITTNFSILSATYTILIALFFGMYVSMLVYFLRKRINEVGQSSVTTGFLGIVSGVLGVGCAACGSFLLTTLSLVGASSILSFLPLGGSEFGILGVVLLATAVYITAKKIQSPLVCKIDN